LSVVDMVAQAVASSSMPAGARRAGKGDTSVVSSLKTLKMLRVVRVFRVFRFWRQLWDLALMIVHSMKSLILAMILLAIIVYVFAVCLTINASEWLKLKIDIDAPGSWESYYAQDDLLSSVHHSFGSLARTVYSLIQCVLSGVSWHEKMDQLLHIDTLSPGLILMYILFVELAVLNIITGVFVDEALSCTQRQKDFQIEQERQIKQDYLNQLQIFFETIDADGSGCVTVSEIMDMLEDATLSAYFSVLGFETSDAKRLFKLLDVDGSGEVEISEFLDGCMKLKGNARSIDVHEVIHECRCMLKIQRRLHTSMLPNQPLSRDNTIDNSPAKPLFEDF